MAEFDVGGMRYQSAKMPGKTQFHVARRLAPVLKSFDGVLKSIGDRAAGDAESDSVLGSIAPFLQALHDISDDDANYVIDECLKTVSRELPGGTGWAPIIGKLSNAPMIDLDMVSMMMITANVLKDQLASFTAGLPSILNLGR